MDPSTRVFWPVNCLSNTPGNEYLLVGWNNAGGDIVVVAALPFLDIDLVAGLLEQDTLLESDLTRTLSRRFRIPIRNPLKVSKSSRSDSPIPNPSVLSPQEVLTPEPTPSPPSSTRRPEQLYARFNHKRLSIVGTVNSVPAGSFSRTGKVFARTSSPNGLEFVDSRNEPCLLITFDPPNPAKMHYFSLDQANLYEPSLSQGSSSSPMTNNNNNNNNLDKELAFHTSSNTPKSDNWDVIIAQLNCVYELQAIILQNAITVIPKLQKTPSPPPLSSSTSNHDFKPTSNGTYLNGQLNKQQNCISSGDYNSCKKVGNSEAYLASSTRRRLSFTDPKRRLLQIVMSIRYAIELGLKLLETPWIRNVSSLSLFCTAQQIDLRLNQLCYLPHEYMAIVKQNQQDWHWLTPDRNKAYIRFNNHIWLGTNDLIFGTYLCSIINANAASIGQLILIVMNGLCSNFIDITHWLMEWPAGFKLNTQLAQFIGDVTIWIIVTWYRCLELVLRPRLLQILVSCLAISGCIGGATLQISLIIDILSVLSFHLYLMYQSLARVYSHQIHVLLALFRVFRGKKYNVLRHRVDHGDYDIHQLLLGTIMFTVLLFLLPTVLAFYAVFALARLAILGVIGLLGTVLAFLNYFPLFPLLLRVKSPRRVPSGVKFDLILSSVSSSPSLYMKSKSMKLSEIFKQYLDTTSQFCRDIFNMNVLKELCTGGLVNLQQSKLYASLYSVLPSHRGSAQLLYAEISEYLSKH